MHTEFRRSSRSDLGISAIWAFAEATFFFIVPDVWLTRIALRDFRTAVLASLVATAAAVLGGALMFECGAKAPERTESFLEKIPGISTGMIASVREQMHSRGNAAMLRGPLTGTPYKIYASEAGRLEEGRAGFAAWSVAARLPRFLTLVVAAAALAALLRRVGSERMVTLIHLGAWATFYAAYFAHFGW